MFDITNDKYLSYFAIAYEASPIKPKELLKTASINIDYNSLPRDAFADPIDRRFPIHDPQNTAISAIYIYKQANDVSKEVKKNVFDRLKDFGLDEYIPLLDGEQEMQKTASEYKFLLPTKMKLPAATPDMLLKSASVISQNIDTMSLPDKVEAATNLVKIAKEFGIEDIPEWAKVYGQQKVCNLKKLASAIHERYVITDKSDDYLAFSETLHQLMKDAADSSGVIHDGETNRAIAYELYKADSKHKIPKELPDAFQATFNEDPMPDNDIYKSASDYDLITVGGSLFYRSDIESILDDPAAGAVFGDLVKSASSVDDIIGKISSLPPEVQEEIAAGIEERIGYKV